MEPRANAPAQHLLIADTIRDFDALIQLARDPALDETLADRANTFQQDNDTPKALGAALQGLVERDAIRMRLGR